MLNKDDQIVNTVTQDMVDDIVRNSKLMINTVFDKCTILACKLPSGFVIVESSACVDPDNYSEELGFEICMNKIVNKVWELEGYRLQNELNNIKFEPMYDETKDDLNDDYEDLCVDKREIKNDCYADDCGYMSDIACGYCFDVNCNWRHK